MSDDFDPNAVPIRPASTVMIVDDRPDLSVLMIRRNSRMIFAGGMWVFPGGAVDPGEADEFEAHCDGLNDAKASERLGLETGGLAFWVAAIRENFEEAGLLLGTYRHGGHVDLGSIASDRAALNAGSLSFLDLVQRHDLRLHANDIHYIAHWVTPLGSPRRFSARFFVSRPPVNQQVALDGSESVDWAWVNPSEMLERHSRGELTMMTPTVRMLQSLAKFPNARSALDAARANPSDEQVRVVYNENGSYHIVVPGEEGYETADETRETGWLRFRPL